MSQVFRKLLGETKFAATRCHVDWEGGGLQRPQRNKAKTWEWGATTNFLKKNEKEIAQKRKGHVNSERAGSGLEERDPKVLRKGERSEKKGRS